jgi:ethanolamine utilization protein EutN
MLVKFPRGSRRVKVGRISRFSAPRLWTTLGALYLGRVIGTVIAERKLEGLRGQKLLMVQPIDHQGQPTGDAHAAVDTVQAGPGDLVHLVGSREACLALEEPFVAVDAAIVGIVDQVDA